MASTLTSLKSFFELYFKKYLFVVYSVLLIVISLFFVTGCIDSCVTDYKKEIKALEVESRIVDIFKRYNSVFEVFSKDFNPGELEAKTQEVIVLRSEFDNLYSEVVSLEIENPELAEDHKHLVTSLEYIGKATHNVYRYYDLQNKELKIKNNIEEKKDKDLEYLEKKRRELTIISEDKMDLVIEIDHYISNFNRSYEFWADGFN